MFEAIRKKLNGKALQSQPVGDALAELLQSRDTARGELAKLKERRRHALLEDAEDKAVEKLDRDIERLELRLEKIDLAEGPLREQLAAATAAERARRWQDFRDRYQEVAQHFIADARKVITAHAELRRIKDTARRDGFEHDVTQLAPPPSMGGSALCAPDLVDIFERAIAGVHFTRPVAVSRVSAPRPAPAPPRSHAVMIDTISRRQIGGDEGPEHAPPLPDDEGPLEPGEMRARVLRGGYQAPDGQSQVGRRIRLSREIAIRAAAAGAIEIIDDPVPARAPTPTAPATGGEA